MLDHGLSRLDARPDIWVFESERPYLYVPHEVLVAVKDLDRLEPDLDHIGAKLRQVDDKLGVAIVDLPESLDVHATVKRLRVSKEGHALAVAPHHFLSGVPKWAGGPANAAVAGQPSKGTISRGGAGKGVSVAVLDTGYSPSPNHTDLDAHLASMPPAPEQTDGLPPNGWIDDECGHGTFISGIIARLAPGARISAVHVLDSDGFTKEIEIAKAIVANCDADILNLSLGGYTDGDRPPVAIGAALRHVGPHSAIVAAAGNDATSRPFWPAAFKRVIAVGAIDDRREPFHRARFSNYGPWVDCCARGVDIESAFVDYDETAAALTPAALPGRSPQAFSGWAVWSGTSFAAPHVAGEIAARMTEGSFATPNEATYDLVGRPGLPTLAGLGVVVG